MLPVHVVCKKGPVNRVIPLISISHTVIDSPETVEHLKEMLKHYLTFLCPSNVRKLPGVLKLCTRQCYMINSQVVFKQELTMEDSLIFLCNFFIVNTHSID